MTELETLRQQLAAAVAERDRATLSEDALQEKVDTMADAMNELGLTCGCSVDRPGDLCMHHSPRLLVAVKRAEAAERERDAARCDVAHAQFDRDAALNLVESAEERVKRAEAALETAKRELAATIKAKQENDERYMIERDEALAIVKTLKERGETATPLEYIKRAEAAESRAQSEIEMRKSADNQARFAEARARDAEATYPYMCRIGHAQIGHSTDGESCPVCVEKGKTRFAAAEAAGLRKALGMMRDELMRLHEIICEEDAQSIEVLLKETDALMNAPCPSSAILAVVDAARAVADDYIAPSSLILALRKALCAIDGGSHV